MKIHIKQILITGVISVLFAACSNDTDESYPNEQSAVVPDIVLQERSPLLPETVTKEIVLESKRKTRSVDQGAIGNSDKLLGYSYQVGNSILGDYENVGTAVLDVNKIKAIDPQYVMGKRLFGNETQNYAYTDYERYQHNSTITKKKTSGFSISIAKIFSFGRKKKTTEVFSKNIDNSTNRVYGELNIKILNSMFTLDTSEGARKMYARQCLSNTFIRNLYTSTLPNIQDSYGYFVLSGYYTGGKAFGLYCGMATLSSTSEGKEKDMTKDISASFTYKSVTASPSLKMGRNSNNSTTNISNTTKTEIYVKTLGGNRDGQAMVSAVALDGLKIDLTSWVRSLNNVNTHTIIDIADQGLCPLSGFVLEENFKRRFDDVADGTIEGNTKLVTPSIEILPVYVRASASTGEPLYEVAAVLTTRQGDKIVLSDGLAATTPDTDLKANNNATIFKQKVQRIFTEKKKYFDGLRFTSSQNKKLNPSSRIPYVIIRLNDFKEDRMCRFKNPQSGVEYIYDKTSRIAIAHYIDKTDGNWILDDYGIRDWIESLPVKSISMATIANSYRVIGL